MCFLKMHHFRSRAFRAICHLSLSLTCRSGVTAHGLWVPGHAQPRALAERVAVGAHSQPPRQDTCLTLLPGLGLAPSEVLLPFRFVSPEFWATFELFRELRLAHRSGSFLILTKAGNKEEEAPTLLPQADPLPSSSSPPPHSHGEGSWRVLPGTYFGSRVGRRMPTWREVSDLRAARRGPLTNTQASSPLSSETRSPLPVGISVHRCHPVTLDPHFLQNEGGLRLRPFPNLKF